MPVIDTRKRLMALQGTLVKEHTRYLETRKTCEELREALKKIRGEILIYCATDRVGIETIGNITVIVSQALRDHGGDKKEDTEE